MVAIHFSKSWRLTASFLLVGLGASTAMARQDSPPPPPRSPQASQAPKATVRPPETLEAAPSPLPAPLNTADPNDPPSPQGRSNSDSGSKGASVLLLANGHVFQGEIVEDGTGYYLKHKIGVKQFARRNVEGVFSSLDEAYRHLQARTPANDPDEQMKLALWCLEQKLTEPARAQLETVLALSPDNKRAKAMMFHLNSKGRAPSDPELARASAEVPDEFATGAPRQLNLERLREMNRQRGASTGPPIIFDLAPPVALRRYQEFARSVHPELQTHCARCHDADAYTGHFQLYRTRTKRDLTNELILRANLDATLQLVDAEDLNHSRLLSVAAMTHPPDGRPVLSGPNHPTYRVFLNWVRGLSEQAPGTSPGLAASAGLKPVGSPLIPAVTPEGPGGTDEVFGSARPGSPSTPQTSGGTPGTSAETQNGAVNKPVNPAAQANVTAPGVPGDVYFPPGGMPKQIKVDPGLKAANGNAASGDGRPKAEVKKNEDGTEAIVLPDGSLVPFVSSKALRATPAGDGPDPAKLTATGGQKKAKLDPKALQQFMNRGSTAPATPGSATAPESK